MLNLMVKVDLDVIEAINDAARKSPKLMQTAYNRATQRLRARTLAKLQETPGAPHYPIRWKTPKQRHYVMAKLRRDGNLPYQRTGALEAGWKAQVVNNANGGLFEVFNDTPYADYVQGDYTQPYHLDTGWPQASEIISGALVEAESVLIDTYFVVIDPFAGARG